MKLLISNYMDLLVICILTIQISIPTYGQNLADSTATKSNDTLSTALVLTGSVREGIWIMTNYPIPYLGFGHFLQKNWVSGSIFFGTELGLLFLKSGLENKVGPQNIRRYPNISNDAVYIRRNGLSSVSNAYQQYANIAYQSAYYVPMIDLFSAYRTLHNGTFATNKVQMDGTSIPNLLLSPFKPKYLVNPWVFLPIILCEGGNYFESRSDKPLSSARDVTLFNSTYTPTQAAFVHMGVSAFKYILVATGEEMMFRGIIQTQLTESTNPTAAIIISSLLFGAWHIPNNGLGNALGATLIGLYAGYRYQHNGYDLGEVIALHFWLDWFASSIGFIQNPQQAQYVFGINWKL